MLWPPPQDGGARPSRPQHLRPHPPQRVEPKAGGAARQKTPQRFQAPQRRCLVGAKPRPSESRRGARHPANGAAVQAASCGSATKPRSEVAKATSAYGAARFAGCLAPQGAKTGASRTVDAALAARGDKAGASSAGAAFRPHHPGHCPAFSTATSETLLDDTHRQRGLTETCAEGCHRARESHAGHDGAVRRSRVPRGAAYLGRRSADRRR